jgi:hypothetical protein
VNPHTHAYPRVVGGGGGVGGRGNTVFVCVRSVKGGKGRVSKG